MTQEAQLEPEMLVQPWRALLAIEGEATSDGRIFEAATWRELPLPFSWQVENWDGHSGSIVVGRIDTIERRGNELWGTGVIDLGQAQGREVVRQRKLAMQRGVSIDAAVADGEVTQDDDGTVHFSTVEIGGATIVSFPAFAWTEWELTDEQAAVDETAERPAGREASALEVVTADGQAWRPPAAWFANPGLDRRAGLHVEESGRVLGHLYGWGECHLGSPPGQCVQPPHGGTYDYIVNVDGRGVVCDNGTHVKTGPVVLNADHAELRGVSWLQAKDHYAHTGLAVADVVCGEDDFGIWVAGALRPGLAPEVLHAFRASAPSGDWRTVGGRLQLVAILAVSTPGFPALAASYSGGEVTALVARSQTEGDCGCGSPAVQDVLERLCALEAEVRGPRHAQAVADVLATLPADRGPLARRVLADVT